MKSRCIPRSLLCCSLAIFAMIFAGCGRQILKDDLAGPTLLPGWNRIKHAAVHAATDPKTWAPAALSATVYASGRDRSISDWATSTTPVFGSRDRAGDVSDVLLASSRYAFFLSAAARLAFIPRRQFDLLHPPALAVAGVLASLTTGGLTDQIKETTGRLRPDGSDFHSFPSGHTSMSSLFTTLAAQNVGVLPLPATARAGLQSGLAIMTAGTAWARVEGKNHYLSDVLAGAALGHFIGVFVNDAFLGVSPLRISVNAARKNPSVGASLTLPINGK